LRRVPDHLPPSVVAFWGKEGKWGFLPVPSDAIRMVRLNNRAYLGCRWGYPVEGYMCGMGFFL